METKTVKLNDSGVVFINNPRAYLYDSKHLKGITGVISKHLFKDKFKGIPESVLENAKEYGSAFHEAINTFEAVGVINEDFVQEIEIYKAFKENHGINNIHSEYLVTDKANFASAIDQVVLINNKVYLVDIKTTYSLDKDYLKWQLSTLKVFFEIINPEIEVAGLLAFWYNKKDKVMKLEEIDVIEESYINALFDAELNGLEFRNPFAEIVFTEHNEKALELITAITNTIEQIKDLEKKEKELKSVLTKIFNATNADKWITDSFEVTKTKDYVREGLDSKALLQNMPDVYELFKKNTPVKGSIKMKLL